MKKILNVSGLLFVLGGLIFKANHLPGASILILLSVLSIILSLVLPALKDNKEAGMNDRLNFILIGISVICVIGATFKIFHWPGASALGIVGYILMIVLPGIILVDKTDFKISKQFFFSFLLFFILVLGLFPNNPIHKLLGSGRDYTISEKAAEAMHQDSINNNNH
jgi:hypothetical protein